MKLTVIPFHTGLKYTASKTPKVDEDCWKTSLAARLKPLALPELYTARTAIGGQAILPIFCAETQNDHVQRGKSNSYIGLMLRVQRFTQFCVKENDAVAGRVFIQAQCKYGMHNNGDHGDNPMRKKVCLATVRKFFECCGATELLDFLDEVEYETDDLADSFSLGLQKAIEWYSERAKAIYGGQKADRFGVDEERAALLAGQGICIIGLDFGTRNYALCVLEVTGLDAAREEIYVTCDNEVKTHWVERPHFRVLRWQLLDLLDDAVRADYRGPSKVYRRLDAAVNITASAYDPAAEKRKEKRKRSNSTGEKAKPDDRKRAKKEKPKIISIDIREDE